MQQIYQFKPHLRLAPVDRVGMFLIGEREHYLLSGDLYAKICPLIDGRRSVWELVQALDGQLAPPRFSTV
jgi:hypothetical protein